jgi:SprT protein
MNIQAELERLTREAVDLASQKLGCSVPFPYPSVYFSLKGRVAGLAHLQTNKIGYNLIIAEKNWDDFSKVVPKHEVAHLIDWQVYNGHGHGRTWKMVMRQVFGLEPIRCHSYDCSHVKRRNVRRFEYRCGVCGKSFTAKAHIHNKFQRFAEGVIYWNCCGGKVTKSNFVLEKVGQPAIIQPS